MLRVSVNSERFFPGETIRADFGGGDATKHLSVKKRAFQWKGGNSVNGGFAKDFYRKGNSVKRSGPFSEPPDAEKWKVAVLIPLPQIGLETRRIHKNRCSSRIWFFFLWVLLVFPGKTLRIHKNTPNSRTGLRIGLSLVWFAGATPDVREKVFKPFKVLISAFKVRIFTFKVQTLSAIPLRSLS